MRARKLALESLPTDLGSFGLILLNFSKHYDEGGLKKK